MVQIDMFGRGWKLQLAITAACSMAFILFGTPPKPSQPRQNIS